MKSAFVFTALMISAQAFANCPSSTKVYRSEADDEGTRLPLTYVCKSSETNSELCVYLEGKLASISGTIAGTADMNNIKVNNSSKRLNIELKTESLTSAFDSRSVKFNLDKNSMMGTVVVKKAGLSPFDGRSSAKENLTVTCSESF